MIEGSQIIDILRKLPSISWSFFYMTINTKSCTRWASRILGLIFLEKKCFRSIC